VLLIAIILSLSRYFFMVALDTLLQDHVSKKSITKKIEKSTLK
jgi:hypothetical protein